MRYLKGTINLSLHYTSFPVVFKGFSDANSNSDLDQFKSTSGYIFTFDGTTVSWNSKKHICISKSIMVSEFMAFVSTAAEAEWLRNILLDLPISGQHGLAVPI